MIAAWCKTHSTSMVQDSSNHKVVHGRQEHGARLKQGSIVNVKWCKAGTKQLLSCRLITTQLSLSTSRHRYHICCTTLRDTVNSLINTGPPDRMLHRKWRSTKQHPSRARACYQIRCCLLSFHFLCDILLGGPVQGQRNTQK